MKKTYDFLMINIGIILTAVGIALFKIPNNFATGGATGIAIIISGINQSLSVGALMVIVNLVLLTLGLIFLGFEFEIKTVYSTIVISFLVWGFEKVMPIKKPLTGDTMLELFIAILFLAAGSALLFYHNASSGGTDIVARILNQKTHLHIGKTVLMVDLTISIFAVFTFGIKIGLYSILGVIIKGFLIDSVIRGLYSSRQVVIISKKSEEIKRYILNELKRGVTIYKGTGGKTGEEKLVLNTVMSSQETFKLRGYVTETDDKAFIVVNEVFEIYGKGFKSADL